MIHKGINCGRVMSVLCLLFGFGGLVAELSQQEFILMEALVIVTGSIAYADARPEKSYRNIKEKLRSWVSWPYVVLGILVALRVYLRQ
jgi:hypothetical protein